MGNRALLYTTLSMVGVWGLIVGCSAQESTLGPDALAPNEVALASRDKDGRGSWEFTPLATSAVCTIGGSAVNPLVLAAGFGQSVVASEPSYADVPDMNVQNETGPHAGRYLYQVHEVGENGSLSVVDLQTGVTKTIAQRADWESIDPTVWTPWGTLLFGEETNAARFRDPNYPDAEGGRHLGGRAKCKRRSLAERRALRFPHRLRSRADRDLLRHHRESAVRQRPTSRRRRAGQDDGGVQHFVPAVVGRRSSGAVRGAAPSRDWLRLLGGRPRSEDIEVEAPNSTRRFETAATLGGNAARLLGRG